MITEEKQNVLTGILITIAIHLVIIIAFLVLKIDNANKKMAQIIDIEFSEEEYKTLEQLVEEKSSVADPMPNLSNKDMSNIASNVADKLDQEINTERYIEEVMNDLGMDEINPHYDNSLPDDPVIDDNSNSSSKEKKDESSHNFGQTRITYNVPGRKGRYIDRPIYRCQGGGKIVIDIEVDQTGAVVQASVSSSNTSEECVPQTALESAKKTTFNSDYSGAKRVKGTITYIFVAQ